LPYENLEIDSHGGIATIWLNRPQVRNALDETLIAEISHAVTALQQDAGVRVLVLAGRGKAFCAGADLNWMKRVASYSGEQNQQDAMRLAQMLKTVHASGKPVVARVHGPAFAGGMGLAAACDIVVAEPTAEFCLSEVRIGLIPSTISPYVIRALGVQACRRYMLTAERVTAVQASRIGFVHELSQEGAIDEAVGRIAGALLAAGPHALARTKALIEQVGMRPVDEEVMGETAALIAAIRTSDEGREGVSSFLEKRKPAWVLA
jgi:methylglutaconyl-CoA hydratase